MHIITCCNTDKKHETVQFVISLTAPEGILRSTSEGG